MSAHERGNKTGIVYVLQNPAFQETILKIGHTTGNLKDRIDRLSRETGVPARFTCYYARRVDDARYVEKKLHSGLGARRFTPGREFFEIDPEEAKSLLEIAPGEDVTPENELEGATTFERGLAKRSMFRLKNFGIGPGRTLTFVNNNVNNKAITATVNEDGKTIVMGDGAPEEMRGNVYSLSNAAAQLLGYKVAGPDHWLCDGKSLNQIRQEVES